MTGFWVATYAVIEMQSKDAEDAREGVSTGDDERDTDNRLAPETEPVARVFDPKDGDHVADLHSPALAIEFRESPIWEVDVLEEIEVPEVDTESEQATVKDVEQAVQEVDQT